MFSNPILSSKCLYFSARNSRALCFSFYISSRWHSLACRFPVPLFPFQQKDPYSNNVKALRPFPRKIRARDVTKPFDVFLNSWERAPRRPQLYSRHGYVSSNAFCENLVRAKANPVPRPRPWQIPCSKTLKLQTRYSNSHANTVSTVFL